MSDTNRQRLSYITESAFGVPNSGNLVDIRYTGESLKCATQAVRSQEIRSDRQIADVIRTDLNAEGDINIEKSYGAHDDFIASSLFAASLTWSTAVTVTAATISAASGDNSFNDSGAGFGSLAVNQWVKVTGFANAANNGFFKILSKTTSKIVVFGGTLVTAAASPSITIKMGEQVVNGTTATSFAIEKKFTDLTNKYAKYLGMYPSMMKEVIKADQIVTGSFSFLGKSETSAAASIGSGYTSAPTNEVLAGVEDVYAIMEAGSALAEVMGMDWQLNNNLRKRLKVGNLGPSSIGAGTIDVDGSLEVYLTSEALLDKYLNFSDTSLALVYSDSLGKSYVYDWPRIKFTDGSRLAGGINQDIMAAMKFMAKMHETEGVTMRITRWP
jgi:hypothetical protein